MKINIAVVEDNHESQIKIKEFIRKYDNESDDTFIISVFSDGDEIVDQYEAEFDIILMDIEMKRMNGMTAAEKIREIDPSVVLIFITNMTKFAVKGYAVNALSYLLKPVEYFAFRREIEKSVQQIKSRKEYYLVLPTIEGIAKVSASNIGYMESIKHQVIIHTIDEKEYVLNTTLKEMQTKLKEYNYYRINSCYIVNLDKVDGVKKDYAQVMGNELKISRPRKKGFKTALTKYLGGQL
ncbi:MAG: LytTR family DNA-binding domain-containing protein [Candidatus Izemoplasma sp.]|nr:LytTR family DNA-binding domain-containing protein [Candidatus Izemoplasma sp.]